MCAVVRDVTVRSPEIVWGVRGDCTARRDTDADARRRARLTHADDDRTNHTITLPHCHYDPLTRHRFIRFVRLTHTNYVETFKYVFVNTMNASVSYELNTVVRSIKINCIVFRLNNDAYLNVLDLISFINYIPKLLLMDG